MKKESFSKEFLPKEGESFSEYQKRKEQWQIFLASPSGVAEKKGVELPFPLEEMVPSHHWEWAKNWVKTTYDFSPENFPAFYSDKKIFFWQGAQAWLLPDSPLSFLQLKTSLKKGHLGIYDRSELLAHEAVHLFRAPLSDSPFEEMFAYLLSDSWFRRVLGPLLQNSKEVFLFLLLPFLSALAGGIFGSSLISLVGILASIAMGSFFLFRLVYWRRAFFQCYQTLASVLKEERVLPVMVRLQGEEIWDLSRLKQKQVLAYVEKKKKSSLRWQLLDRFYFSKKEKSVPS